MDSAPVQSAYRFGKSASLLLPLIGAAVFFHAAYCTQYSFLIFGYVICLVYLARGADGRIAFWAGLAAGLLSFAPQLGFFWTIFGPPAILLWTILACWTALFVSLTRALFVRLGPARTALLAPFLWTGLEYFRSEMYALRFGWLNVGYAISGSSRLLPLCIYGVYGVGFILAFAAACIVARSFTTFCLAMLVVMFLSGLWWPPISSVSSRPRNLQVAGMQMEFPSEDGVISGLNRMLAQCPDAELLVLSEYTFAGPVPVSVQAWCRENQKYLVIGGEDPAPGGNYYNTAFVIGPKGDVVFKQAKSVPIQFFSDGLPAETQEVWDSPWGRIGICICYDLSYTQVTDRLVRLGARALIVLTMDVKGWGKHEHDLHRRIAPVRAVEYGLPVFRVASSGISQLIARNGSEQAVAPFGADRAIISGTMILREPMERIPPDRFLAPLAVGVTAVFMAWLAASSILRASRRSRLNRS